MLQRTPAIECENVRKVFGGVVVLNRVSIALRGPGVAAIVGANGAGKTTLLNVLTGFLPADNGEWHINDVSAEQLSPSAIARLGVARTFQRTRTFRSMTALENVRLFARERDATGLWSALIGAWRRGERAATDRAVAALAYVGVEHVAERRVVNLSYGEQKLVALACCVAAAPRTWVLDEPVSGLSLQARARVLEVLRDVGRNGALVLLIEHDLGAVTSVADEVLLMARGEITMRGSTASVLNSQALFDLYVGRDS